MNTYIRKWAFAVATLFFLVGTASAQLGFSVTNVEVKPGAAPQFENFIMEFKAAAEDSDWPTAWTASQTAVGNTNSYQFVAAFESHSELSTPVAVVLGQARSPEDAARILQGLRDSAVSLTTATYYPRSDLSNPPAQALTNPEVIVSIGVNANAGAQLDFEEWIRRVVDSSGPTTWNTFVKGYGEGPNYVFRSPTSWAALDQQPSSPQQRVIEQYGPIAGNTIIDIGAASTASANYSLVVNRPDLSYSP